MNYHQESQFTMSPSEQQSIESRLERIESALAHLQHDVYSLNTALLGYFSRLQEMDSRFVRLEHELHTFHDATEKTDAELDRPPHY